MFTSSRHVSIALKIPILLWLILSRLQVWLTSILMGCCSLPSLADKFKAAQHRMQADSVALCKHTPSHCLTASYCNLSQTLMVPSRLFPLALHLQPSAADPSATPAMPLGQASDARSVTEEELAGELAQLNWLERMLNIHPTIRWLIHPATSSPG
jgi:hypothetical protein